MPTQDVAAFTRSQRGIPLAVLDDSATADDTDLSDLERGLSDLTEQGLFPTEDAPTQLQEDNR